METFMRYYVTLFLILFASYLFATNYLAEAEYYIKKAAMYLRWAAQ